MLSINESEMHKAGGKFRDDSVWSLLFTRQDIGMGIAETKDEGRINQEMNQSEDYLGFRD